MRHRRKRVAVLDEAIGFERWMHSEHMARGETAAERAKQALAHQSRKGGDSKLLADNETDLGREAKLAAGTWKLWGAPGGLTYGENTSKSDAWLRNIEQRDLGSEGMPGTVVLDDEHVLQLEDDAPSQPGTPPTEQEAGEIGEAVARAEAETLLPGAAAGATPAKTKPVDPVRVVAEMNRGTRFRPHLHGTMSAHQQEADALNQYAQAMKKMNAEMSRREGKVDWEGTKRGSTRQRVPIQIASGNRVLTREGNLSVGGKGPAPGEVESEASKVGQRVAGFRRKKAPAEPKPGQPPPPPPDPGTPP